MSTPTDSFDFQNFYSATLTADITAGSLTISLDTVPAPSEGILVIDPDSATPEIIYYTSKSVGTVTCPADGRGWDSTTAAAHLTGTTVIMAPVAYMLRMLKDGSLYDTTTTGWTNSGKTVSSVTNNGNRSYDITFSTSVASQLSPGMRLRTTRTVTAPTQCADLEASSSQYFNDTTVSGITFTDDFCAGAWIKLESYTAGEIISRWNGTSGWTFDVQSTGQIRLTGFNAGAGNNSYVQSYQSIPLGKWVHVTAQLDMSAFTATTTTSYVMIDGADVPSTVVRAGTNPTALVQAGNLEVGATNGGTVPFDGKLAQVFVSSAKITQANVKLMMSQGLTTADTATYSLASAYSLSNSLTDLNTTSANNLTANGGALATATDSPFTVDSSGVPSGTTDYALVMAVSTTTATVQVPEGCTIPTSGGVSAVAYATSGTPFGFPADDRWAIDLIVKASVVQAAVVSTTTYNPGGMVLPIPKGRFVYSSKVTAVMTGSTDSAKDLYFALSTSASSLSTGGETLAQMYTYQISDVLRYTAAVSDVPLGSRSATSSYFLVFQGSGGGVLTNIGFGLSTPSRITLTPTGL